MNKCNRRVSKTLIKFHNNKNQQTFIRTASYFAAQLSMQVIPKQAITILSSNKTANGTN